nr:uncharacterized protein LOC107419236 isoform X2 [Ziziphus jujuba var. spinosa]
MFRGRGRGFGNKGRPQCQLCGKVGHVAPVCFYNKDNQYSNAVAKRTIGNGGQFVNLTYLTQLSEYPVTYNSGLGFGMSAPIPPFMFFGPFFSHAGYNVSGGNSTNLPNFNYLGQTFQLQGAPIQSHAQLGHIASSNNGVPAHNMIQNPALVTGFNPTGLGSSSMVNFAAPITIGDPNWYLDSGATNHVVGNTQNLLQHVDYNAGSSCS